MKAGWTRRKPRAKRKRREKRGRKGEEIKEEKAPAKAELTSAAIRYIDLHRQNAVRVELLKSPQIASASRGKRHNPRKACGSGPP